MKLIFAGTPSLAAEVLLELSSANDIALVITREDAPVGRRRIPQESPVAIQARELGLAVLKANRIGAQEIAVIRGVEAELGVVVAYGALFPDEALDVLDWWNVHFSLLPSWRGASPAQHAIWHGYGGGVSIFRIVRELDAGPIIAQVPVAHATGETAGEYLQRLTRRAIPVLLEALSDPNEPQAQVGEISYAPKLSASDARLNFRQPASDVERQVLAMNPEPGAWCLAGSDRLKVLRARIFLESGGEFNSGPSRTPGGLLVSGTRVIVSCGTGSLLELIEVQPAGGRPMSAIDWCRGTRGLQTLE